jgi:CspA family cold shock protein
MMGTVRFYNEQRGYGFLIPHGFGPDVFFHITNYRGDQARLLPGAPVEYYLGPGNNGRLQALDVRQTGGDNE